MKKVWILIISLPKFFLLQITVQLSGKVPEGGVAERKPIVATKLPKLQESEDTLFFAHSGSIRLHQQALEYFEKKNKSRKIEHLKKISWWIWTQKLLLPHGFIYYVFNKTFYHDPTARNIQHLEHLTVRLVSQHVCKWNEG